MTVILQASGLGKQYGRRWALRDCTLAIPEGKVVGLVGPNGAGKTTFLQLAVGLLAPTAGTITVLGGRPADGPAPRAGRLRGSGHTPVYAGLSVAKHLRMGAFLNPNWDSEVAESPIEQLGLDPRQRAGKSMTSSGSSLSARTSTIMAFQSAQPRPRAQVALSTGSRVWNILRFSPEKNVHAMAVSQAGSPTAEDPKSMTALRRKKLCLPGGGPSAESIW